MTAPSKFDEEGDDQQAQNAWEMLGTPKAPQLEDRLAPQVDREFLRRFVRDELPEAAAATACQLILLFACWSKVHEEILVEEQRPQASE